MGSLAWSVRVHHDGKTCLTGFPRLITVTLAEHWGPSKMSTRVTARSSCSSVNSSCGESYQTIWTPKMHSSCRWSLALWTSCHIVGRLTVVTFLISIKRVGVGSWTEWVPNRRSNILPTQKSLNWREWSLTTSHLGIVNLKIVERNFQEGQGLGEDVKSGKCRRRSRFLTVIFVIWRPQVVTLPSSFPPAKSCD